MSRKAGFTTSILHSDRDAPIEHGSLHKPLHLSVAYGYRDARELAAVFQGKAQGYAYGRQGNPTSAALEEKVNRMEGGVATVCFGTGMAAIGAIMLALLREGDHVVSSAFLFGNTNSLFNTIEAHGSDVSFVDATDVRAVEAAITPATRLVFVETIANPRTQVADLEAHRRAVHRARADLRRRQHHDLAVPVPAQDRRREPRRQRVDQVHRRPWQRAGRQHHRHRPVRLDALPEHLRQLQGAEARALGDHADPQEGSARLGRNARGGAGAPYRRRCGNAGAADGSRLRQCAGAGALSRGAHAGARRLLPGPRLAPAARAGDANCSTATGRCCPSNWTRHWIASISSIACRTWCCRRTSATTGRSPFPLRTRFSTRWVPSAAPAWGSRTR